MTSERTHRVSSSCDKLRTLGSTQHRVQSVIQSTAISHAPESAEYLQKLHSQLWYEYSEFSCPRFIWNHNDIRMYIGLKWRCLMGCVQTVYSPRLLPILSTSIHISNPAFSSSSLSFSIRSWASHWYDIITWSFSDTENRYGCIWNNIE